MGESIFDWTEVQLFSFAKTSRRALNRFAMLSKDLAYDIYKGQRNTASITVRTAVDGTTCCHQNSHLNYALVRNFDSRSDYSLDVCFLSLKGELTIGRV